MFLDGHHSRIYARDFSAIRPASELGIFAADGPDPTAQTACAVFVALPAAEDGPPEWVQILPAPEGGRIDAKEGRWWWLDPHEFVAAPSGTR